MVRFVLDPSAPPKLTTVERERLEHMTDAEITAAAMTDPDNPPLSAEELAQLEAARFIRSVRATSGLSQERFASVYRIKPGRLRDLEQGRTRPDSALLAYLTVISREPDAVRRALANVCVASQGEMPKGLTRSSGDHAHRSERTKRSR
jgi:putative transcriptional regulator